MKEYKIKNKISDMKRKGKFDKYFDGDLVVITVRKPVANKLQKIINSSEMFENMTDLLTFFIFNFEENKNVYNYQVNKFRDEYRILKEHSYRASLRADYFAQKSVAWKNKTKKLRKEMRNLKVFVRRHIKKKKKNGQKS